MASRCSRPCAPAAFSLFILGLLSVVSAHATLRGVDSRRPTLSIKDGCKEQKGHFTAYKLRDSVIRLRGGGAVQSAFPRQRASRVLVAIGGTNNGTVALNSMESLWARSPQNGKEDVEVVRRWRRDRASMSCGRDSLGVAICESRAYAVGGYNGTVELCSVESIDLASNKPTWIVEPRLRKRRSNVGAAVVGHQLFVIGGYNGTHDLPNVEVLQLNHDGSRGVDSTWQWAPQLLYRRSGAAIASLHGKLYAIGGCDGTRLLETAEELGMSDQAWTQIPSLLGGPRGGAAAATVGGRIYVMGGGGAEGRLAKVESLDPREGKWRAEKSMSSMRSGPAAVGIESLQQIFVVGGYDGERPLDTVERFDARMGSAWVMEAKTRTPRWGCGVVAAPVHALGSVNCC